MCVHIVQKTPRMEKKKEKRSACTVYTAHSKLFYTGGMNKEVISAQAVFIDTHTHTHTRVHTILSIKNVLFLFIFFFSSPPRSYSFSLPQFHTPVHCTNSFHVLSVYRPPFSPTNIFSRSILKPFLYDFFFRSYTTRQKATFFTPVYWCITAMMIRIKNVAEEEGKRVCILQSRLQKNCFFSTLFFLSSISPYYR